MISWVIPLRCTIKMNCDASWTNKMRMGGDEVIRRDHHGNVVKGINEIICASNVEYSKPTTSHYKKVVL